MLIGFSPLLYSYVLVHYYNPMFLVHYHTHMFLVHYYNPMFLVHYYNPMFLVHYYAHNINAFDKNLYVLSSYSLDHGTSWHSQKFDDTGFSSFQMLPVEQGGDALVQR